MKALITGATGFVGTALHRSLEVAKHDIIAVTRRAVPPATAGTQWISLDLGEPGARLPELQGVDAVVYLAQSRDYRRFPERALDIFQINVAALLTTLDWAREHGVRKFVYASSANVYEASRRPIGEDSRLHPESFYGQTKLAGEQMMRSFSGHLYAVVLRLFSVYGPGQTGMLVPDLIERVRTQTPIDVQGPSGLPLTPAYVTDVVACIERALSLAGAQGLEVMNVGGPQTMHVRDIGEAIGKTLQIEPLFRSAAGPDPPGYVSDNAHLRARLGFEPAVRFDEGIRRTLALS